MKQPDKTIAPLVTPFLQGFKRKYDLGLYYHRTTEGGWCTIDFISHRIPVGRSLLEENHETDIILAIQDRMIIDLLFLLQNRWIQQLGELGRWGRNPRDNWATVFRNVTRDWPFDPARDQTNIIRASHVEEDVIPVFERFKRMMMEDGFAWFARYADPLNISRDINDPIGCEPGSLIGHPLWGQHDIRAEIGIAAACVAEPHRVQDLHEQWLNWARRENEHEISTGGRAWVSKDMERRLTMLIEIAREQGYNV